MKLKYIEISVQLLKDKYGLIKPLNPEEFNKKFCQLISNQLGINLLDHPDNYLFRFFHLEEDPKKRQKRLKKIHKHGSDRTNPKLKPMHIYEEVASETGIDHLYFFDCASLPHFSQYYSKNKHNALLIYDSKKVYKPVEGLEYTFRDMQNRSKAIIAVVALI